MRELRFVSGDGDYLNVETQDGERMRLPVDDSVKAAVRLPSSKPVETRISPREIQDAIRSGSTIAELVKKSGDGLDYITKFATPVLEELEHMVASALSVRIEIEPDRFNEARTREFGELVGERLMNGGASEVSWIATRTSPFTWEIKAKFATMGGEGVAIWTFDPRVFTLTAENETAVGLTSKGGFGDSPIPKLRVIEPSAAPTEPTSAKTEESVAPTELLDAFRQRREATSVAAATEEEAEDAGEAQTHLESEPESTESLEVESKSEAKKGRAPMPSWDEIVFGSKTED